MNNFQLPNWGNSAPVGLNFGPEPMNIPMYDAGTSNLGKSDFATASMTPVGATSVGGYQPLEFGMNLPSFQLGLQGLGTLGNLWGTFQSNKLARDSFNFSKGMAQQNMVNSIKSYNTTLSDRTTSRGFVQGDSKETTQKYINDNKL